MDGSPAGMITRVTGLAPKSPPEPKLDALNQMVTYTRTVRVPPIPTTGGDRVVWNEMNRADLEAGIRPLT
jgi:hypothetical protein